MKRQDIHEFLAGLETAYLTAKAESEMKEILAVAGGITRQIFWAAKKKVATELKMPAPILRLRDPNTPEELFAMFAMWNQQIFLFLSRAVEFLSGGALSLRMRSSRDEQVFEFVPAVV